MSSKLLRFGSVSLLSWMMACGGAPPTSKQASAAKPIDFTVPVAQREELPAVAEDEGQEVDLGPIPVTRADPAWGSRTAPVTLVVFGDFQCPFCRKLAGTLDVIKREYGASQLRIVWKNSPLPFHKDARPAAEAAMAVFERGGSDEFWAFHDALYREKSGSFGGELIEQALGRAGMSRADLGRILERGTVAKKIDEDIALARQLDATGTPTSFINGVRVNGAQSAESFREVIDAELKRARAAIDAGTPATRIYAARTAENYTAPTQEKPSAPKEDLTVYKVPIDGSPVRGSAAALVTLVVFSDFQCPFCARVAPTIEQLSSEYGAKLRVVFKNNPLPFHPRAEPAAELALEARAQKGDAAFWKVHDLLFAQKGQLEDADLRAVAAAAGLNVNAAMANVGKHKHATRIDADQDLADDVAATGTPHFFINGRRLIGAQPIEKFRALVDAELALAEELVTKGTDPAKVYETIQQTAKGPAAPEQINVPAPTRDNPSRGPQNAKVVVQVFSDFQCPFCKRVEPTLTELEAAFPGKIRIVWRNRPLPFHKQAEIAAEAAMEAYRQKGAKGFWKMHDLLFANQGQPGGLERQALDEYAKQVGLDLAKFGAALDSGAHRALIDADIKIADDAGLSGTPGFSINGYKVSGAQPLAKFKKVVKRALAEAK